MIKESYYYYYYYYYQQFSWLCRWRYSNCFVGADKNYFVHRGYTGRTDGRW